VKRVLVRYRVKPDRAAENEQLVSAVYDELAQLQPQNFHYATFKLDDGVSFAHIAVHAEDNPLAMVSAFQRFQEGIRDRCHEGPVVAELELIGSYRFLDEVEVSPLPMPG
jgi:hypothetical protein